MYSNLIENTYVNYDDFVIVFRFDVFVDIVNISRNSIEHNEGVSFKAIFYLCIVITFYNKKTAPRDLFSPVNCHLVQTLIRDKKYPVRALSHRSFMTKG